jgi:hypothetical protein
MSARPIIWDAKVSVYDGRVYVGHLIRRGPAGTEAFDINEHSLGLFENDDTAATAVWRHARGGQAFGGSRP